MESKAEESINRVHHIVVARAVSWVRLRPEEALIMKDVPAGKGRAEVIVKTRYADEGFSQPVPRELLIESAGTCGSLSDAVRDLSAATMTVLPALAFTANARIDEAEPELAFEINDGGTEHGFSQRYVPEERGFPKCRRYFPTDAATSFIRKWLLHREAARIYRGMSQYAIALRNASRGRETLANAHIWMAVEALTKALLRHELRKSGFRDDNELIAAWGIEKNKLDREIRLRLLFQNDEGVYVAMKEASDGLEHGFADYTDIHTNAVAAWAKGAEYVRSAVLDLVGVDAGTRETLLRSPWNRPINPRANEQILRGTLIGRTEDLAHPSQFYPAVPWALRMIDYCGEDKDGRLQCRHGQIDFKPIIGEKASFRFTSFEVQGVVETPSDSPQEPQDAD
jgi:hypothetical protein